MEVGEPVGGWGGGGGRQEGQSNWQTGKLFFSDMCVSLVSCKIHFLL